MNREFLMLAQEMPPSPQIGSWKLSEKLDGMRAIWIPESRGQICTWANTDRKSGPPRTATGLWSRYGNVIEAPAWWLAKLPSFCVDGELYMGRKQFQALTSIVKAWKSERDWTGVGYYIIDSPTYQELFTPGKINNPNYKKDIPGVPELLQGIPNFIWNARFDVRLANLNKANINNDVVKVHSQETLPWRSEEAYQMTLTRLREFTLLGGEGVVVRNPMMAWIPKRTPTMYKLKPQLDSEGIVTGYTPGKGRLVGMTGALVVSWKGKSFELAGLTDMERTSAQATFPIGTTVTFLYRELTEDGKPKEARYYRKRPAE